MSEFENRAVLRIREAAKYLSISRPGIYRLEERDPTFPRKIKFANRTAGYHKAAIDEWLEKKSRGE